MNKNDITLEDYLTNIQSYLRENLDSFDISKISLSIRKSTRTITNYLNPEYKPIKGLDLLTINAIVSIGNKIISEKNKNNGK